MSIPHIRTPYENRFNLRGDLSVCLMYLIKHLKSLWAKECVEVFNISDMLGYGFYIKSSNNIIEVHIWCKIPYTCITTTFFEQAICGRDHLLLFIWMWGSNCLGWKEQGLLALKTDVLEHDLDYIDSSKRNLKEQVQIVLLDKTTPISLHAFTLSKKSE